MKAADHILRGVSILIAEDDAILALDTTEILRQAGAEIIGPVATLKRTLLLATEVSVSAALLDVNLRDAEVFPAALALQERGAGIVFHTAYADVDSLKSEWPHAQVLAKPASPGLLISAINQVCDRLLGNDLFLEPASSTLADGTTGSNERPLPSPRQYHIVKVDDD